MVAFGLRFAVDDSAGFEALRRVFYELKQDKDADAFRSPDEWMGLLPEHARARFQWLDEEERRRWAAERDGLAIAIEPPGRQLGGRWVFDRVLESLAYGEYALLSCELVEPPHAEIHIDPWAFPYGGLGPLIALVEAFGFAVAGVNEYGRYQTRQDLTGHGEPDRCGAPAGRPGRTGSGP